MKNLSTLGLDVELARSKGLKAAIKLHDSTNVIKYQDKLRYFKMKHPEKKDNIQELMSPGLGTTSYTENPFDPYVRGDMIVKGTIASKAYKFNTKTGNTMLNQAIAKNKKLATNTAYLLLGKLAIEATVAKLPKEVGMLGPLIVAEIMAAIPSTNEKVVRAQEAALAYAMYVTVEKTEFRNIIRDLTTIAEEQL